MSANVIHTIAKNNNAFAASHHPSPLFSQFPNTKAAIILSCMDPRANPTDFFALDPSGPPIIRNAGGRATEDALRSMRVLAGIMSNGRNTLGAVAVVHHTDCGLQNFSNERVGELLVEKAGLEGDKVVEVRGMDFGSWNACTSPEESVLKDMEIIKNDPYLPKDLEVVGFVYNILSGKTTEVKM